MNQIGRFEDDYFWLSNFSREGGVKPTLEHQFQAMKATNVPDAIYVMESATPGEAKQRGRSIQIRTDWEWAKDGIMYTLLRRKFFAPSMKKKLLDTGDAELIEGNTWGDRYWGVDIRTGQGQNKLGLLLMQVRTELLDS